VLPQLGDDAFLTDGGMEMWLIFVAGLDLPEFASFPLVDDPRGVEALRAYFAPYIDLARERGAGLVLDAPTWRASSDWARGSVTTPRRSTG
jgi:S-methylmethionine-dependent homocysteine/selenocysteine methylase